MDDGGWGKGIMYDSYLRTSFLHLFLVRGGRPQNPYSMIAVNPFPCRDIINTMVVGIGEKVHLNDLGLRGVNIVCWQFLCVRNPLCDSMLMMLRGNK